MFKQLTHNKQMYSVFQLTTQPDSFQFLCTKTICVESTQLTSKTFF